MQAAAPPAQVTAIAVAEDPKNTAGASNTSAVAPAAPNPDPVPNASSAAPSKTAEIPNTSPTSVSNTPGISASVASQQTQPSGNEMKVPFSIAARQLHGYMMLVAWGLMPWVGMFVGRSMKKVLGKWWYATYAAISLLGVTVLSIAAVFILFSQSSSIIDLKSSHTMLGVAVTLSSILQMVLGFAHDALKSNNRKLTPLLQKIQPISGAIIFVLANVNIMLGLYRMSALDYMLPTTMIAVYAAFVFSGFTLCWYGHKTAVTDIRNSMSSNASSDKVKSIISNTSSIFIAPIYGTSIMDCGTPQFITFDHKRRDSEKSLEMGYHFKDGVKGRYSYDSDTNELQFIAEGDETDSNRSSQKSLVFDFTVVSRK